jgi:hypothetical protein
MIWVVDGVCCCDRIQWRWGVVDGFAFSLEGTIQWHRRRNGTHACMDIVGRWDVLLFICTYGEYHIVNS